MLVSTIDRAIDGYVPIDITSSVGIGNGLSEGSVPGAVDIASVAFPHGLPWAEELPGQVAPREPHAIPIDDSFNDPTIILKRSSHSSPYSRARVVRYGPIAHRKTMRMECEVEAKQALLPDSSGIWVRPSLAG